MPHVWQHLDLCRPCMFMIKITRQQLYGASTKGLLLPRLGTRLFVQDDVLAVGPEVLVALG